MSHKITIIGLGAGDWNQLTLGVYQTLKSAKNLFLRTKEHPVVERFEQEGIQFTSFDAVYEENDQFEAVYNQITENLLTAALEEDVVYAVPGHPLVAERTVQLLLNEGSKRNIEVEIGGGQSFMDALFTAVKVDPIEGFQLLDGTAFHAKDIHSTQHLIIGQVYDAFVASDVKLTLMEKYPDDHRVNIVTAAGSQQESVKEIPLYELDRVMTLNNLTSIYVPPLLEEDLREFTSLRSIIKTLRGPNGCPWDLKQTHLSLKKYLIEEAYELLEAIDEDDIDHMVEELGDVLLQIMLHSQIGEDEGMFTIEDVIEGIASKMIRRHPHVFGNVEVESAEDVVANWKEIKASEKKETKLISALDGIGKGLPAVIRAFEIQRKAAKTGFDWEKAEDAWLKVKEEIEEFQDELSKEDKENQIFELGDLLFAIINTARLLSIHPEEALERANQKFIRRFSYVEEQVQKSGRPIEDFDLKELDQFWDEAKLKGL